jgi:ABC-2 type transport system permease protein
MTVPAHLFALWVAFTFVAFAFIGLGLVIAALADNVPAVQALGQCIFLPMLVIGGVAVSLASLPPWAQHLSAFFPGRYAVESLQAAVTGRGFAGMQFSLLALTLTGIAGLLAGAKLFRWEAQQRFAAQTGKAWMVVVVAVWLAAGLLAEARNRIDRATDAERVAAAPVSAQARALSRASWEEITASDVASLSFRVPPDEGVVTPFALPDEEPNRATAQQLEIIELSLSGWAPGRTGDDVQRVRNLLCVAAVPDVIQQPTERFVPAIILRRLTDTYPRAKLIKILTWIVLHPEQGTVITDISGLGVPYLAGDEDTVRERVYLYSIKFIARLSGRTTA